MVGLLVMLKQNLMFFFFATNVIPTDGLNVDDFISSRINVTKNALKQMNIMK